MDRLIDRLKPNLRIWSIVATVSWGIMAAMWGCERFYDPRNDFADGGVEGPFAVKVIASTNEGLPVFQVDHQVDVIQPGQYVGWISHLCIDQGVSLRTRPDIVRLADGEIVAAAHDRLWTPEDKRCGAVTSAILMPAEAKYGLYELRRVVWSNPLGWLPQRYQISGFRFRVVPPGDDRGIAPGGDRGIAPGTKP